jgi:hypothetical protein
MSEWFTGLGYGGQLATWLVASFLLYAIAAQLAWQFQWLMPSGVPAAGATSRHAIPDRYLERDYGLGRLASRLEGVLLNPWLEEAIRLIYYLGIPFLAAVNGLLAADLLGISGTDWVDGKSMQGFLWEDWVQGAGLALMATLAMTGVWCAGRATSRRVGLVSVMPALSGPFWQRLLHALYDQVHWAFYRSGPILWMNDLYWGTFVGLGLVLLEASLNPVSRWALKSPETAGPPLFRLGMAWVSALLFLATRNLWFTVGVHLILAGLLGSTEPSGYSQLEDTAS